jgi:hypothetical protein
MTRKMLIRKRGKGVDVVKMELRYFNDFINDISGKRKLILYGNNEETQKTKKIIKLYDRTIEYIVDDYESDGINSYLNLIYEEKSTIYILIVKEDYLQACKNLESLGFHQQEDYRVIFKPKYTNLFERFPLDVNIGYTSVTDDMDKELPGITVFGNKDNKNAYKIVTVGGSTSDSQAYLWKCWSQILYEKLKEDERMQQRGLILYSAGISGYRSSQELMKLERDLLDLNPDLVISFSGVNDTGITDYPFVQYYSQTVFDLFVSGNISDMNGGKTVQSYTCGKKKSGSMAQNWLKHIRIMRAMCQEFGIHFVCFLQPMLGNKRNLLSKSEKELVLNGDGNILDRTEAFLKDAKELLEEIRPDYIYDISDLFNHVEDVYIDDCHVTETGNRIIAYKIYDVLCKEKVFD